MFQLICGDSARVMKARADRGELVDLIVSDPPYGIDYVGVGHGRIANDKVPPLWCVPLMTACLKPGAALVVFTSEKVEQPWVGALAEVGHQLERRIFWDKGPGPYASEVVLVTQDGYTGEAVRESWSYPVVREHELKSLHDTPKPVALVQRLIAEHSKPGDLVFDPFVGSCPTGVAAVRLGDVDFVGVELESKYLLPGWRRISRAQAARDALR